MSWGSNGKQIGDHHLIEAGEAMIDVPGPLRGPMPVEGVALGRLAIPVPFDRFPKGGDAGVEIGLGGGGAIEVLASGEQAFDEKRAFDQIAGIVEHAEDGESLAGVTIEEMGPRAVIAGSVLEKGYDFCETFESLFAGDEAAIDGNDNGHHAETARAKAAHAIIPGNVFPGHAR